MSKKNVDEIALKDCLSHTYHTGYDKQKISALFANIFLPIIFAYVLGAQKNHLNETVLLSTHNICFS